MYNHQGLRFDKYDIDKYDGGDMTVGSCHRLLLAETEPGVFILRNALSFRGSYTLSVSHRVEDDYSTRILTYPIDRVERDGEVRFEVNVDGETHSFKSLPDLVECYARYGIEDCILQRPVGINKFISVVGLVDFPGITKHDLPFVEGEEMIIISQKNEVWWMAWSSWTHRVGSIISTLVRIVEEDPKDRKTDSLRPVKRRELTFNDIKQINRSQKGKSWPARSISQCEAYEILLDDAGAIAIAKRVSNSASESSEQSERSQIDDMQQSSTDDDTKSSSVESSGEWKSDQAPPINRKSRVVLGLSMMASQVRNSDLSTEAMKDFAAKLRSEINGPGGIRTFPGSRVFKSLSVGFNKMTRRDKDDSKKTLNTTTWYE